jgi:hypothetical protein
MKKWIVAAIGGAGLVVALSTPAIAGASAVQNQASTCGGTHGAFASVNTTEGGFGEIVGKEGPTIVQSEPHGQQPGAAGYNNSTASAAVC